MQNHAKTIAIFFGIAWLCAGIGCESGGSDNTPLDSANDPNGTGGDADSDADTDWACEPSDISIITEGISSTIGTVGIVEWSTEIKPIRAASIELGPDTQYGRTVPADLVSDPTKARYLSTSPWTKSARRRSFPSTGITISPFFRTIPSRPSNIRTTAIALWNDAKTAKPERCAVFVKISPAAA